VRRVSIGCRHAERPLRAPSRQNRGVSLIVVDLSGTIRHVEIRLSLCRLDRECDVVGAVLAATVDEGRRAPAIPLERAESTSSATPSAQTRMPACTRS
jgi:hypothetical protein